MANNNDDIKITLVADTSDVEKSLKNVEKQADKMAKSITKDGDKIEKSLDDVSKSAKDIQSAFKNVNMKSLTSSLTNFGKQASKIATNIKKQLTDAFKTKTGKLNVDVQTTDINSMSNSALTNMMASSAMTGGAIGASIKKALAQTHTGLSEIGNKLGDKVESSLAKAFPEAFKQAEVETQRLFDNMASPFAKIGELLSKPVAEIHKAMEAIKGSMADAYKYAQEIEMSAQKSVGLYSDKAMSKSRNVQASNLRALEKEAQELQNKLDELAETDVEIDFTATSLQVAKVQREIIQLKKSFQGKEINTNQFIAKFRELEQQLKQAQASISKHLKLTAIEGQGQIYKLSRSMDTFYGTVRGKFAHAFVSAGQAISNLSHSKVGKLITRFGALKNTVIQVGKTLKTKITSSATFQKLSTSVKNLGNKFLQAGKNAKKMGNDTRKATGMMKTGFGGLMTMLAPYLSIFAIFGAIKTSVNSYTQSLSDATKYAHTFGSATGEMNAWLEDLDSKINMNKSTVMNFSTNLYRMATNLGIAQDEARKMSQSMSELGMDIVAYTGDENSLEALAGALRGEYDSIQNYGYALSASAVQAKALAMGLDASSESALVLARQSLLLEQSGDILGYASQNTKTLSGQMAMLKENVSKLATAFGSMFGGLLTACLPVLNAIVQAITKAVQAIANALNSIFSLFGFKVDGGVASSDNAIANSFGGIASDLGDASSGAGGVADNLASGAESAKEIAKGLLGIDELNVISSPSNSGGGSGSGGSGGVGGAGGIGSGVGDLGIVKTDTSVLEEMTEELTDFQKGFLAVWEKIKEGFMKYKDGILEEWQKLKDNMNNLSESIKDFWVGCWENGLDETAVIFGEITGSLIESFLKVTNVITESWTKLIDHLNPKNNENTANFISKFNEFLTEAKDVFETVVDRIVEIYQKLQPTFENLGDIFVTVGGLFLDVGKDILKVIDWILESPFVTWLIDELCGALEWVTGGLEDVVKWLSDAYEGISDFIEDLTWDDVVKAVQTGLGKLEDVIWDTLEGIVDFLLPDWFEDVVDWFTDGWGDAEDETIDGWDNITKEIEKGTKGSSKYIDYHMSSMAPNVGKIWDTIKTEVPKKWQGIKDTLSTWGTKAKDGATSALSGITTGASNIWNNVKSGASTAWSNIKTNVGTWAGNVKTQATNSLTGVTSGVSTIWGNIKNGVSGAWNNVKGAVSSAASSVKDQVGSSLSGAKDKASSVWTNIKNGVGGGWNTVKSTVATYATNVKNQVGTSLDGAKSKVTNIWTGIKNGVSSAWNGIKTAVQTAVNNVKKCLNFKWSLPKPSIPKFTVSGGQAPWGFGGKGKLPSISIKWNAKGGIFDSPTIFNTSRGLQGVGEAGAEAIIPISNLWKELGQQFDKQNQVLSNKGNNQPIHITLEMDGKQVAKGVYKQQREMTQMGQMDWDWL